MRTIRPSNRDDDRSVVLELDAAVSAAPVFVQQHDHQVVDVKELPRLEATL